jgi:hypothetical protein
LILLIVLPLTVLGLTVHRGFAFAAGLFATAVAGLYLVQRVVERPRI